MNLNLAEYYRLPEASLGSISTPELSGPDGFFSFGPDTLCYGPCSAGVSPDFRRSRQFDAVNALQIAPPSLRLPFEPSAIIDNLRRERYEKKLTPGREKLLTHEATLKAYYFVRAALPVAIRRHMQKAYFSDWKHRSFPVWPVDFTVDTIHERLLQFSMLAAGVQRVPFIWFWPNGAPSCLIMTHDVETSSGRDFTSQLMNLDESRQFRASFQVIPEKRYSVPSAYVQEIRDRGFEFNIHDLNHDGHLYQEHGEFLRRAQKINEYGRQFGARGFRAGSMYRNLDWYDAYEFSYDMSVPNVAHLEPKRGGCCTVFPYFVGKILEIPLTTAQDYSIIHILDDYSIDLWKKQVELIRQRNGLMSFLAHPDYLINARNRQVYETLLDYLRETVSREKIWTPLPGKLDQWWRARAEMTLVPRDGEYAIEGPLKDQARVAYAILDGDRIVYELDGARMQCGPAS